jgi:hypothetical protein
MGIKDDANNLDAALERGRGAARGLAAEMLGVDRSTVTAVRHAVELGQALAVASKVSESIGGPLVKALAVVASIGAAFVSWKTHSQEIANVIGNINAEMARSNALARNDVRLANETAINLRRNEALQQLEKERGLLGKIGDAVGNIRKHLDEERKLGGFAGAFAGLLAPLFPQGGIHLFDYAGEAKAINDRAEAEKKEMAAAIARSYASQFSEIKEETRRIIAQRIIDPGKQQEELAGVDLTRQLRGIDENGEYSEAQRKALVKAIAGDKRNGIRGQFDEAVDTIRQNTVKPMGEQLGRSFASSIGDGIAQGIQSGSIGKGFRTLTAGILSGLGDMLETIGERGLIAYAVGDPARVSARHPERREHGRRDHVLVGPRRSPRPISRGRRRATGRRSIR